MCPHAVWRDTAKTAVDHSMAKSRKRKWWRGKGLVKRVNTVVNVQLWSSTHVRWGGGNAEYMIIAVNEYFAHWASMFLSNPVDTLLFLSCCQMVQLHNCCNLAEEMATQIIRHPPLFWVFALCVCVSGELGDQWWSVVQVIMTLEQHLSTHFCCFAPDFGSPSSPSTLSVRTGLHEGLGF